MFIFLLTCACDSKIRVKLAASNKVSEIPTVAIDAPSAVYAKTGDSVDFGVTYTGAKTINLTADDITIGGAATATKTILNGTTATPTVRVTGFSGDGALTISVAAGKSSNAKLGVDLGAGPSAVVTVDNTLPLTPSLSPSSATYNGTRAMTFAQNSTVDATFKEFRYTTTGTAPTSCSDGTASSTSYPATGTANQTIIIVACDHLGQMSSSSASATLTYDVTAPTLSVSAPSASSAISTATITYTVTYTGADTITLAASDVTLNTTSGASASKAVSCSSATCTVTLTSLTGNGTIGISVAAGTASDLAGNLSLAAGPSTTFTADAMPPTISFTSISPTSPGTSQTPTVTLSLTEATSASGLGLYSNVGCSASIATAVTGASGSNTVTTTSLTVNATTAIYAKATDVAGNVSSCTSLTSYLHDNVAPTVAFSSVSAGNPGSTLTPTILGTGSETSTVTLYLGADCSGAAASAATANTVFASPGVVLTTSVGANTATAVRAVAVDTAGNASACTSLVSYTHDNVAPTVTAVTSTKADGSYKVGEVIGITVTFSESVAVTGTPTLTLETGGTDAVVNYTSGTGTNVLTFNYTVAATETAADLDYASTTALALNSGTIRDASLNNATLTLVAPSTSTGATIANGKAIVIDTTVPVITYTSINPTTPGSSQTPAVTLSLSEAGSTTSLGLFSESGCTSSIATAVTGTSGSNAVTTTSLTANSTTTIYAKVTDVAGNASVCTSMVSYVHDNAVPTVTAVTSTKTNGSYTIGEVIGITVTFTESVTVTGTPQITLETGGADAVVDYTSGSPGTVLTFNYTVAGSETSADLDYASTTALALNSGTIRDASLNNATLTLVAPSTSAGATIANGKAIVIDTTVPVITYTSINPTTPGSSQTPAVTLSLSEAGATTSLGLFSESGCTSSIATAVTGTSGSNAVTTTSLTANATTTIYAKVTDVAGNASACTSMVSYVHDNAAPAVTAVTSTKSDGSYKVGEVIGITVTFSESVTVTGTPQLTLETGGTDALVNYTSGSPGTVLTFNYTVAGSETSADLDYASTTALALNSGTIRDASLNNATLTLVSPSTSAGNTIANGKAIVIDTTAPTVAFSSVSVSNPGSTLTPTILGTGSETSTVTLYLGADCSGAAASAATANTVFASPGVVLTTSVGANTATAVRAVAVDTAGNASACTSLVTYTHDNVAPVVSVSAGVSSVTANGSYKQSGVIAIKVTFSESVTVTGTPQLTLETGGSDAVVDYTSGSGSTVLVFNYTVGAGQTSADLDYASTTALALNSGTINDSALNAATLTLATVGAANSLGANNNFVIDTTVPTITYTSISPASPGSSQTPAVTLSLSEASGTSGLGLYSESGCTTSIATAVTGTSGSNAVTTTSLTSGSTTTIYAKATDVAGNVSTCTSMVSYTHSAGGGGAWTATTTTSAHAARTDHKAVWTGSKMIVWGGYNAGYKNDGKIYDPVVDSWSTVTTTSAPTARTSHTVLWTGSKMIVWGGDSGAFYNTGGLYDPVANTWSDTTTTGAPTAITYQSGVWTGSKMIVWGGYRDSTNWILVNTGGIYDPVANTWSATTTTNAPADRALQSAIWTGSKMIVWGGTYLDTGGLYDPVSNAWTATTTTNAPDGRIYHVAEWTGSKMFIWGGRSGGSVYYTSGGLYDPIANSWTSTTSSNVPTGRVKHSLVWTGSKMIVWGGYDGISTYYNTGGLYDPQADTWTSTITTSAATLRAFHTAVWTGSRMIVWGGAPSGSAVDTGGIYTPPPASATDSWSATATATTSAPGVRYNHTAVWTGSKMIVWGGNSGSADLNDGGLYDPVTDSWTATTSTSAPAVRMKHTAVWTGSKMIVWGGFGPLSTGGLYDPVTNAWTATTSTSVPTARYAHAAVWTGSVMIVWGAAGGGLTYETGSKYDPVANTWTAMATTQPTYPASDGSWTNTETRWGQSAVWTGSKMIVFGGQDQGTANTSAVGCTNVGGVYDPAADTWTATTSTNAPGKRSFHTAIWTGSKMVVWGGGSGASVVGVNTVNTGSVYDPVADAWTATTSTNAPDRRSYSSAIWTGAKMVVWGGEPYQDTAGYLNSGAEYNPVTNAWVATTTTSVPTIRDTHTAVWTGGQMIIWGGSSTGSTFLNTGGVYTPQSNTTSSCSGGGVSIGGHCWYTSGTNVSCSTACSNVSLTYNTATLTYAGSSGTLAQCKAVLDGVFGGNNTVVDDASSVCSFAAVGCGVDGISYKRCTPLATTEAISAASFNRVCACQ